MTQHCKRNFWYQGNFFRKVVLVYYFFKLGKYVASADDQQMIIRCIQENHAVNQFLRTTGSIDTGPLEYEQVFILRNLAVQRFDPLGFLLRQMRVNWSFQWKISYYK